jgi:hypothetical protein
MSDKRYEFTPQQEEAIGQLVTDRWGDNFQTGIVLDPGPNIGLPFLYSQTGPAHSVRRAVIAPDGTVLFDG